MSEAAVTGVIFATLPSAVPPPPNSTGSPPLLPVKPPHRPPLSSRRATSLILFTLASSTVSSISFPCTAAAFGIQGPKDWLKEQKKKASKFILAPIEASRGSLQAAYLALTSSEPGKELASEIRSLIGSASRDCVANERSSVVAFQARTGVEVCTFRLLVKNAASLLDERDPLKLETEALLNELIGSFACLGELVDTSDLQVASEREKVEAGLRDTMLALDSFEQGIKHCIGV